MEYFIHESWYTGKNIRHLKHLYGLRENLKIDQEEKSIAKVAIGNFKCMITVNLELHWLVSCLESGGLNQICIAKLESFNEEKILSKGAGIL